MSKAKAEELGLTWLAEIGAHGVVAGPDASLQEQPANAIAKACAQGGHRPAPTWTSSRSTRRSPPSAIVSTRKLGIDEDKVNVNGGAIALGHPIGMSGARITLHLALELKRRGGGIGAAALCGGGGQGDALIVKVPAPDRDRGLSLLLVTASRHPRDGGRRCAEKGGERVTDPDVLELVARARAGEPLAVGRLLSLVEAGGARGRQVAAALADDGGRAHVVGLTGPPGVGKSTTTSALVAALRARGEPGRCAGGRPVLALLRRRAARRPRADGRARRGPGGVHPVDGHPRASSAGSRAPRRRPCACSTPPGATSCSIETVGVGQSEVDVVALADTTVVLLAPGMGDGVQAAKAGILEVADVFVVNKADRDGATQAVRELRHMIGLGERGEWRVPGPAHGGVPRRGRGRAGGARSTRTGSGRTVPANASGDGWRAPKPRSRRWR